MKDPRLKRAEQILGRPIRTRWEEEYRAGVLEGTRDALLLLLTKKFGRLPESITNRVQEIDSVEGFDPYLDRVLVADSLAEMELDN